MSIHSSPLWKENFSMKRISSWRVGGKVRALYSPKNINDLIESLPTLLKQAVLWVGYGSNLMVRDGGFNGIAVHTTQLTDIYVEDDIVYASAGIGCPKFAKFCANHGLEDSSFLSGIPGTIGGALAMNAGCHGSEIWDFIQSVDVLTPSGIERQTPHFFNIAYRHVEAKNKNTSPCYFIGALFSFKQGTVSNAKQKITDLLKARSQTQPIGNPTSGSVFCNPPNDYAGRLIEECGLKNTAVGDAVVSNKHANFIINNGNASATDIENLIVLIQNRVQAQTNILLKPEVKIVGTPL